MLHLQVIRINVCVQLHTAGLQAYQDITIKAVHMYNMRTSITVNKDMDLKGYSKFRNKLLAPSGN